MIPLPLFRSPTPFLIPAVICCLLLFVVPPPSAQAASPTALAPSADLACRALPVVSGWLLAADEGWSFKHLFRGFNERSRIVQVCVVVMCLALFIIMKK
jgi:hypothetical protein